LHANAAVQSMIHFYSDRRDELGGLDIYQPITPGQRARNRRAAPAEQPALPFTLAFRLSMPRPFQLKAGAL
jgi:hypothetical protein